VLLIASGLQGYFVWIGRLQFGDEGVSGGISSYILKSIIIGSGSLLAVPGWQTDVLGLTIASIAVAPIIIKKLEGAKLARRRATEI
jgi:UPF0716 family protein affecting phage T7 exclusion